MRITRTVGTALRALRRNVTRAVLTAVGIIIGVAAVIAMMEIGNGSSTQIQKTIASMGANNLLVQPGAASSGGVSYGGSSVMTLTPEDCARHFPPARPQAPSTRRATTATSCTRWTRASRLPISPPFRSSLSSSSS
jgi:hypothetical protein